MEQQSELDRLRAEVDRLRQQNAALRTDSDLLRALMDSSTDNIYFKDTSSRFVRINNAMAGWLALDSPEEAVGKGDADFFTGEHASEAQADEDRIMRTGESIAGQEEKETWPTGGTTWVSSSKFPVRDASGAVVGTGGISRDITRHKRTEDERERLLSELQDASARIHLLHGLIPICAVCKRVRDDRGYWQQVETYISDHSEATFSHGLCGDCSRRLLAQQTGGGAAVPDGDPATPSP